MEKEKKQNILIILSITILVLLTTLAVYFIFFYKKEELKPTNPQVEEKEPKNDESNTLKLVADLSNTSVKTNLQVNNLEPEILPTIKDYKKFEIPGENIDTITVNVTNKKAIIEYKTASKTYKKEYNNVTNIFYDDANNDCFTEINIYVFSDQKIYKLSSSNLIGFEKDNIIEDKYGYDAIYQAYLHGLTCGAAYTSFGHTKDGMLYDLITNTKYEKNTYNYYEDGNHYIKKDGTFKLDKIEGKVKLVFIDVGNEVIDYIIDEKNYIYSYDGNLEKFKILKNSKVNKVYYNDEEDYYLLEFDDNKEEKINYVLLQK